MVYWAAAGTHHIHLLWCPYCPARGATGDCRQLSIPPAGQGRRQKLHFDPLHSGFFPTPSSILEVKCLVPFVVRKHTTSSDGFPFSRQLRLCDWLFETIFLLCLWENILETSVKPYFKHLFFGLLKNTFTEPNWKRKKKKRNGLGVIIRRNICKKQNRFASIGSPKDLYDFWENDRFLEVFLNKTISCEVESSCQILPLHGKVLFELWTVTDKAFRKSCWRKICF